MARILLSAIVTEIRGKIGGTVFQSGQGGFQAKRLAIPRDPRISVQISRRIDFTGVSQSWQQLTPTERTQWSGAADPGLSGYTTYMRRNANMRYFAQSPFTAFPGTSTAASLDLRDSTCTASHFFITGRAPFTDIPSGSIAAVKCTRQHSQGRGGFSPSQYKTVQFITGPHDILSSPVDIITAYTNLFGVPLVGRAISMQVIVIDTATGNTQFNSGGDLIIT